MRPRPPPCAPRARPRPSVRSSSPSTPATPDQKLLAYQYLQMLPKIAEGDANKLWIVPSEIGDALKGLSGAFGNFGPVGGGFNTGKERRAERRETAPRSTDPHDRPQRRNRLHPHRRLRQPRKPGFVRTKAGFRYGVDDVAYAAVRASHSGSASIAHRPPAPAASRPPATARTAPAAAASPPAPASGPPCGGCPRRRRRPCSARCPHHPAPAAPRGPRSSPAARSTRTGAGPVPAHPASTTAPVFGTAPVRTGRA